MNRAEEAEPSNSSLEALRNALWAASRPVGISLVVFCLAVLFLTFPLRYTHTVLVPGLVGVFGVPFAVVFVLLQLALGLFLKNLRAVSLVVVFFAVGMGLGWLRSYFWGADTGMAGLTQAGITLTRHVLCAGALVSGIVLGIALMRDWLWKRG